MQCKNGSIADRISILDTYYFENVGAARRMLACICSIMYMILGRHLGCRPQDPTLDISPNFVKGI